MQFLHEPDAGAEALYISGENYKYLFKVRRLKEGDTLLLSNLQNNILYRYQIVAVDRKKALLRLRESKEQNRESRIFHLIWCVIDIKIIEKTLPMLNQLGVTKITFVYCARSQRNFKIDLKRVEKILINSCQQCGRTALMQIEVLDSLDEVLSRYSDIAVLDFGGTKEWGDVASVLVGCEGGFSETERQKLQNSYKIGLQTDFILKSETAAVGIASKLLI